jgi:hypothetical protein
MSSNVRTLTYLIFAYTCIEGLVINIMYPAILAFIAKDILILLLYLAMVTEQRAGTGSLSRLAAPVGGFFLVTLFYVMLPTPVTLLGEAVAVKQKVFYIPLMYAGYAYMRDEGDVLVLMKLMAATSIPVSLFGVYLYVKGPSALASIGANYSTVIASTAGAAGIAFWRVPGTFNSPGQYGEYLFDMAASFIGVLLLPALPKRQRLLTIVALVLVIGALMISGSRSPLLATFLAAAVILIAMNKISGIGKWATGLYGVLTLFWTFFGEGVRDRVESIASWEHVQRFQDTYFGQLFWTSLEKYPTGLGMGIATMGARHFTNPNDLILCESYFGLLCTEMGITGLIAFVWLIVAVLRLMATAWRGMARSPVRALWYALAVQVLWMVILLPIGTPLDAAPDNLYFWFFLGLTIRMYDLECVRLRRLQGVSAPAAGTTMPAGAVYAGVPGPQPW